jgi:rod shape determining protein RodA
MMDRRLIENFDWSLLWVLLAIVSIGLLSVYSALYPQIQANPTNNLFIKQLLWLAVGFSVMFCTLLLDYQQLRVASFWIYLFVILLLLVVLVAGREVNGSKRWLQLAGFQFQPSEFMKVAIVIQLASYFASHEISLIKSSQIVPSSVDLARTVLSFWLTGFARPFRQCHRMHSDFVYGNPVELNRG